MYKPDKTQRQMKQSNNWIYATQDQRIYNKNQEENIIDNGLIPAVLLTNIKNLKQNKLEGTLLTEPRRGREQIIFLSSAH